MLESSAPYAFSVLSLNVVRSTLLFFSGSGGPPGTNSNFPDYLRFKVTILIKSEVSDDFSNISKNCTQMKILSYNEVSGRVKASDESEWRCGAVEG